MNPATSRWWTPGLPLLVAAIVCLIVVVSGGPGGLKEGATGLYLLAGTILLISGVVSLIRGWLLKRRKP